MELQPVICTYLARAQIRQYLMVQNGSLWCYKIAEHRFGRWTSRSALDPPDSYLFMQDGLIVASGVLYALCYFFYIIWKYKDKAIAGPIEYTYVIWLNTFKHCLLVRPWTDVGSWPKSFSTLSLPHLPGSSSGPSSYGSFWTFVALSGYNQRCPARPLLKSMVGVLICMAFLRTLMAVFPDDREKATAYWTCFILQLPVNWFIAYLLLERGITKGQSLEICYIAYSLKLSPLMPVASRITRCLGC
jgi:hypothetical protein